jgi:IS4 transposase
LTIRVIDYSLHDGRGDTGPYRLFTTLVDPVEAPAATLALAYAQQWEIELAFDELKRHQRGSFPAMIHCWWGASRGHSKASTRSG